MKLYMFRTFRLSIIKNLFTVHSAMVYVIQVCRQLSIRSIWSCSKAVFKHVLHIPLLSVHWINSWWWTEEMSETCRVSWQNKFVKLVHLVGFITQGYCNKFKLLLLILTDCHIYVILIGDCVLHSLKGMCYVGDITDSWVWAYFYHLLRYGILLTWKFPKFRTMF